MKEAFYIETPIRDKARIFVFRLPCSQVKKGRFKGMGVTVGRVFGEGAFGDVYLEWKKERRWKREDEASGLKRISLDKYSRYEEKKR